MINSSYSKLSIPFHASVMEMQINSHSHQQMESSQIHKFNDNALMTSKESSLERCSMLTYTHTPLHHKLKYDFVQSGWQYQDS